MASTCDNVFGPVVRGCRSDFDFTLLFEQSILSIGPAALLLLFAPPRVVQLIRSNKKTVPTVIRSVKRVIALVLIGIQLTLLILWTSHRVTRAAIPSAVLSLLAAIVIYVLSVLEHSRSVRPSLVINTYLLISLLFDATQARTLYLRHETNTILALFTASITVKALLLIIEARDKRQYLRLPYRDYSPETTSGIFSRSVFWWLTPIFLTGFRKVLTLDDLFTTDQDLLSEPLQKQMKRSWERYQSSGKYALVFAVVHCLKWPLASIIFPRLCLIGFNYAQPFLTSSAIKYISQPTTTENKNHGYGLIGATVLIYIGIAVSTAHYQHKLYRVVTSFRGAMVSLIYARSLELQSGVHDELAAITLMSTDLDRLSTSLEAVNEIWSRTIEMAIGMWLLQRQLGWVCFAPIVVVIFCVCCSVQVGKLMGPRQKIWIQAVQRRVAMTSSMLGSMKSVKMMGLSTYLFDTLQSQRIRELNLSIRFRITGVFRLLFAIIPEVIGPYSTFVIFAIQTAVNGSGRLDANQIFSSLIIISLLTSPASELLQSIPLLGMAMGCLERIQGFLLSEPHKDQRLSRLSCEQHYDSMGLQNTNPEHVAISANQLCIRPSSTAPVALHDIDFQAVKGSLTMIIGVVGSGKSTLLKAIIGELKCDSGSLQVSSMTMAYCGQTAWLQNATVRQIVCGFSGEVSTDQEWYTSVMRACALDEDVSQFPDGDDTLIGSRGIVLSGGQKQRLALARAVYARKDIIVLDDILSALDARTERAVVERLLGNRGLLHQLRSTVILATHTIKHLHLSDNLIVLGADGRVVEQGTFESLRSQNGFIQGLMLESADHEKLKNDVKVEDTVEAHTSKKFPKALQGPSPDVVADATRRIGDLSVYKYYIASIGWKISLASFITSFVYMLTRNFPQIWLSLYAKNVVHSTGLFSGIYTASSIIALCMAALNLYVLYMFVTPRSGANLHRILLKSVMGAPQSFFDKTDSGITLNRFSQDMTIIDGSLPGALVIFISCAWQSIAQLALIASGSTYMALTCPLLLLALYFLQKVYLRTSRQMRILDLENKSPIYAHFAETLEGLATIRAFGGQSQSMRANIDRLDTSQRPNYLLYCIQRWLNLVLQLIVGIMAVVVVALAVSLKDTTSPALLGVSLSSVVNFNNTLGMLMMFWTSLETSLGVIARLKGFEEGTESENKPSEIVVPPEDWPSKGEIKFMNVSAEYRPEVPVLDNISFTIAPGSKIGICGRTGSGKSTLLSVLLRLLDITTGTIVIDGIDISTVPRDLLRSRLITIPQDPFMLSGTCRMNADPSNSVSDTDIVAALTKVGIWSIIEPRGGLDADMPAQPLSQGQQQLFCLARAMLRNGKVLVLDEATSSVDHETDQLMQSLIREEFSGYTIVTVAHRLDSILGSDGIAVLDSGKLVEFGSPQELMSREGGLTWLMRI